MIKMNEGEILLTESHIAPLKIALSYKAPNVVSNDYAVLMLHGSSFPSAQSFGFRMNNSSWTDHLTERGYEVYALDFLGYGNADCYPEMKTDERAGKPLGRATEVCKDVDKAVDFILSRSGKTKVYLIGHSWGASVAALYATKFPDKLARLVLFAPVTEREGSSSGRGVISNAYVQMTADQRISEMKILTPEGKLCQLESEIFQLWAELWKERFPSGPLQDLEDLLHGRSYYQPADIKTPVLLIRGEWDQYPDAADADLLFSKLEQAPQKKYVVIEKGTHVMHLEKSRHQLYEETLHFLKSETQGKYLNPHAIAVIFEVIPADGFKETYLDLALKLRPELEKISGFISIERFQSIYHPEKILSLSFWENETAIQEWRTLELHRETQAKGRAYVFKDYQLRIAQVTRDYGMLDRKEAPKDSRGYHQAGTDKRS
ncbi:Lysophospholipase, alpha-beta hydrolase superfamily [Pedobacter caeni]|uniref:Lysophospholipase, alpha-beta hydrolase superfamily n=2 Tax=Pedobacter caeni TaxID=288992 RepID=A0A1M5BTK3_9SPHI|nr:Lysophospholipase, alpha-beta hydrolase superfamily [Pedobacter caeni]